MKLVVFFIMVVLCVAGSIFTAFDKMRRLKGVEGKKNQRLQSSKAVSWPHSTVFISTLYALIFQAAELREKFSSYYLVADRFLFAPRNGKGEFLEDEDRNHSRQHHQNYGNEADERIVVENVAVVGECFFPGCHDGEHKCIYGSVCVHSRNHREQGGE